LTDERPLRRAFVVPDLYARDAMHPATAELLTFFEYEHLPPQLAAVSRPFHDLAHRLVRSEADPMGLHPDRGLALEGPEASVALRKLLESKDCAVRAAIVQGRKTT
jgi:hypothetical protein